MSKKTHRPTCPDCGKTYAIGAPHDQFCAAKNCEACGATHSSVIPKNDDGVRVCDDCLDDEV